MHFCTYSYNFVPLCSTITGILRFSAFFFLAPQNETHNLPQPHEDTHMKYICTYVCMY